MLIHVLITTRIKIKSLFQPYFSEMLIGKALTDCLDSNASPDGISYKLLKAVSYFIIRPLNVVYQ